MTAIPVDKSDQTLQLIDTAQPKKIQLRLNGVSRSAYAEPRLLLSDFLRHELGATGTHVGCEHGICGACTVQLDGLAVRSCLLLAIQIDQRCIKTVEGLANADGSLSILQQAFKQHFALQCGFCTPGILLSLDAFLRHNSSPTEVEIRQLLSGHLCRCTGYTNIVQAALSAARQLQEEQDHV